MRASSATAARWWADQVRADTVTHDNGDYSRDGMVAISLAGLLRDAERREDAEAVDRFEAELADEIDRRVEDEVKWCEGRDRDPCGIVVGTDYGPDMVLSAAAERAGMKMGMGLLPWKTSMWVYPDRVEVAAGYGVEYVDLELLTPEDAP